MCVIYKIDIHIQKLCTTLMTSFWYRDLEFEHAFRSGPLWDKLCRLSQLKAEQTRCITRVHEHDSNNNSWMAAHALNDLHNQTEEFERLRKEVIEMSKNLDPVVFNSIVREAHDLYNL